MFKLSHRPAVVAVATLLTIASNSSQGAIIGFLGNFDVINDTGSTAHGFEIELEGLLESEVTDTFGGAGGLSRGFPTGRGFDPLVAVQRYGAPTVTPYNTGSVFGVRVTYQGQWDGNAWDFGTPSGTFVTPGDNCWTGGGVGYGAGTPCDHFGVGTSKNATKTTYSWLLETATPGVLTNGQVNLPAPVIAQPPVNPAVVPVPGAVGVGVQAPRPEVDPNLFGEAMWVKVFTTELEDPVNLEELVGNDPKVQNAVTEVEWQLLQYDPGNPDSPPSILEAGYGAPVGPNAGAILRRYEYFAYTGDYDPETNEALLAFSDSHPNCSADPACSFDPTKPIELGHYLGAQNVAGNFRAPAPVPVPGGLLLLAPALSVLALRRRKA